MGSFPSKLETITETREESWLSLLKREERKKREYLFILYLKGSAKGEWDGLRREREEESRE